MEQESRTHRENRNYLFFILVILVLGSILRIWHLFVINIHEPFRLGALYYEFAQQIVQQQFRLPEVIPFYSQNGLPFAYPPLAFYVEALLIKAFNIPKFVLVNVLPPVLSVISLISFHFLAEKVLQNKKAVAIALLVFAIMPNAFSDQIEAGGLAESMGTLLIIWYLFFLYGYFKNRDKKSILLSGMFLGLNVLSSPGSAYASILVSLLFACYMVIQAIRTRDWKSLLPLLVIAGVGLLISSPYWLTTMLRHGKGIFFVSFMAQHRGNESAPFLISELQKLFDFNIAGGLHSFVLNFLIFLGLIYALFAVDLSVSVVVILFMLVPREGVWLASIPGALLAGYGCSRFWQDVQNRYAAEFENSIWRKFAFSVLGIVLVIFLGGNSLGHVHALVEDKQWNIRAEQISSLEKGNLFIPPDKPVLLIGNEGLKEWGPEILEREVLNIKYGLEWQPYELERVNYLNDAIRGSHDFEQLSTAVQEFMNVDDFYIVSTEKPMIGDLLGNTQTDSLSIEVVYDDEQINILHIQVK